ncbi:hypothetical protein BKA93DRAFT_828539 [Sparassis latifolia]
MHATDSESIISIISPRKLHDSVTQVDNPSLASCPWSYSSPHSVRVRPQDVERFLNFLESDPRRHECDAVQELEISNFPVMVACCDFDSVLVKFADVTEVSTSTLYTVVSKLPSLKKIFLDEVSLLGDTSHVSERPRPVLDSFRLRFEDPSCTTYGLLQLIGFFSEIRELSFEAPKVDFYGQLGEMLKNVLNKFSSPVWPWWSVRDSESPPLAVIRVFTLKLGEYAGFSLALHALLKVSRIEALIIVSHTSHTAQHIRDLAQLLQEAIPSVQDWMLDFDATALVFKSGLVPSATWDVLKLPSRTSLRELFFTVLFSQHHDVAAPVDISAWIVYIDILSLAPQTVRHIGFTLKFTGVLADQLRNVDWNRMHGVLQALKGLETVEFKFRKLDNNVDMSAPDVHNSCDTIRKALPTNSFTVTVNNSK